MNNQLTIDRALALALQRDPRNEETRIEDNREMDRHEEAKLPDENLAEYRPINRSIHDSECENIEFEDSSPPSQ